jgi:hypothetical protein
MVQTNHPVRLPLTFHFFQIHASTSMNLSPARAHIGKEASLIYVFNIMVETEVT